MRSHSPAATRTERIDGKHSAQEPGFACFGLVSASVPLDVTDQAGHPFGYEAHIGTSSDRHGKPYGLTATYRAHRTSSFRSWTPAMETLSCGPTLATGCGRPSDSPSRRSLASASRCEPLPSKHLSVEPGCGVQTISTAVRRILTKTEAMMRKPRSLPALMMLVTVQCTGASEPARTSGSTDDGGDCAQQAGDADCHSDAPSDQDSGEPCVVQSGVCVSPAGECCTLNGHRIQVDANAGCKRLLDEEWSLAVCVAPDCVLGATITCYYMGLSDGGTVIYLANNEAFRSGGTPGLVPCQDITATELLMMPDCH